MQDITHELKKLSAREIESVIESGIALLVTQRLDRYGKKGTEKVDVKCRVAIGGIVFSTDGYGFVAVKIENLKLQLAIPQQLTKETIQSRNETSG